MRHNSHLLPQFVRDYAPDSLWALMIFWFALALRPHRALGKTTALAFGFCVLIECSQLLQPPILVSLRATRIGALVLGHGFLWSDIACYAVGIAVGSLAARVASTHLSAPDLALSRGNEGHA